MKMKTYNIFKPGSTQIGKIKATCITKAVKIFINGLEKPAKYELNGHQYASIRFLDNYTICSDFIIMEE